MQDELKQDWGGGRVDKGVIYMISGKRLGKGRSILRYIVSIASVRIVKGIDFKVRN